MLYAVGSLEGGSFDVYAQVISGLGSAPSSVETGNSPIDEPARSAGTGALVAAVAGAGALALFGGRAVARSRA